MVRNILERPKHAVFLDKVRNCAPTFSSPATAALTVSSGQIMPSEALTDALIASKPPQIKRKATEELCSSGKRYRLARLADWTESIARKVPSVESKEDIIPTRYCC